MDRKLLSNIYLFRDFSEAELEQVADVAELRRVGANTELFREGQRADSLLIIQFGSVQIAQAGDNNTVNLATLGSGAHFGEMSFLADEPRSATAQTLEDSQIVVISYERLHQVLGAHPATAVKFYRALAVFLAGRLRATSHDLNFARNRQRH